MKRQLSPATKERQREAQKKWHEENDHKMERMTFAFEAGTKHKLQNLALRNGISMTAMVQALISAEYEREFKNR